MSLGAAGAYEDRADEAEYYGRHEEAGKLRA